MLLKSDFVTSLNAAEKLRSGEIESAAIVIENHCFSNGLILINRKALGEDVIFDALLVDLVRYREKWRADSTQWSYVEKKLEDHLKKRLNLQGQP